MAKMPFRIPILGSALSWRRSKATIQFCIGHGLQKNRDPCHRRRASGTEYFSLLSALFCTQPILASRLGKESPYNRQLADDPCLILTRSGSELSPPLQDEVDPGVLLRRERGYVRHRRQKRSSHDFAPLCIHWNGKVTAAQPHRQRATDYHRCARITARDHARKY